jgi:two-component system sensor histidine kinase CpxA
MIMKAISVIKRFFASFTIKLFIWFWFITIISIASSRFITQQLSNDSFNETIVQASAPSELKQLERIEKLLKRHRLNNISSLQTIQIKRISKKPINIWLKTVNKADTQSLFLLPRRHQQALNQYINNHQFDKPKTHLFFHTRLIGPTTITMNNTQYQLFISKKRHRQNFGLLLHKLPTWARVAIPAFISFALCLLLAKSFSRPIRIIQDAACDIGKGDFSTRVNKISKRSDELGQLARSFNLMAEQLEQHQGAQKRLIGDVSHELRSPMTRLQMALGLAQETTAEQTRKKYLQRCQIEIERLEKMIADVLSLSRLENTLQGLEIEKIEMNSLLTSLVSDEQFTADDKNIIITLNSAQAITIHADRALITSAISNVLSNAVKYSPDNSKIIVNLSKKQQWLNLTVTDSGHGVPEQALPKLFSPFYRVNLARDRETGGTGLGLAIAKQAVIAHQGTITAKNNTTIEHDKSANAVKGFSIVIKVPCL